MGQDDKSHPNQCGAATARPVGTGDYRVASGDCVLSIAERAGHFWQTIWNHPDNADLKRQRDDPRVLLPGDRVVIPPLRLKEEAGQTEQRHRFRRKGVPYKLRLKLTVDGKPRADTPYVIEIDGQASRSQTTAQGYVEVPLPPGAKRGRLTVGDGASKIVYTLELAGLSPANSIDGVQARLYNLGFDAGEPTGRMAPLTTDAIRRFQKAQGLEVSGVPDQATCDKLRQVHGS